MTAASALTAIGRTWRLWAYRYENGALWHVGPRKWVELHGLSCALVPVLVEEIVGDRYRADVTHYGWKQKDDRRKAPTMIQIRAGSDPKRALMFLSMCVSINADDSAVIALRITESVPLVCEDCAVLKADKQKLAEEISRLSAEVVRLNTLTGTQPERQPRLDDAATRFSLLELD